VADSEIGKHPARVRVSTLRGTWEDYLNRGSDFWLEVKLQNVQIAAIGHLSGRVLTRLEGECWSFPGSKRPAMLPLTYLELRGGGIIGGQHQRPPAFLPDSWGVERCGRLEISLREKSLEIAHLVWYVLYQQRKASRTNLRRGGLTG